MATTLKTSSAITAELEQFYADAEATQDFADDALLDWLDGSLTGFESDQPRDPQQEVRAPKPRLHTNPAERLRNAKPHLAAGVLPLTRTQWSATACADHRTDFPARYLIAAPRTP